MVKFKVLKEGMKSEHSGFEIPIQIILEGYEQGLGVGYLENELKSSLATSRHARRNIWAESNDKILISFRKEEVHELPNIIKTIEEHLERIIKKYATDKEEREKQQKEANKKREQDLEEVKKEFEKLDFGEVSI